VLLAVGPAGPARGQLASVLGVLPEGVVLDATSFPDLQPGARIGFRQPDGKAAPVGEGWVLDVREGRALVGLRPGSNVRPGDMAVRCASLSGPGSQGELRASVQALKTQSSSTGGGAPELQALIGQLDSALDAREAAIRDGACDVASHDQQIGALTEQLQQRITASPATPAASSDVTSQPAAGTAPPPPTDNVAATLQLIQGLAQIAQSLGVVGGSAPAGGPQPVTTAPTQAPVPTDPAPVQGTPPPPPPGATAGAPVPSLPPRLPGSPLPPTPPPVTATPPSTGGTLPGGTPPGSPGPGGGRLPVGRPPLVTGQPTQGQWWTITPPPGSAAPGTATPGTSSGAPGSGSGSAPAPEGTAPSGSASTPAGPTRPPSLSLTPRVIRPAPGTSSPTPTPTPGTTAPATTTPPAPGPLARATPAPLRLATVQGVVRTDTRSPVPDAVILVGGKRARTNAEGLFLVEEVPLGRHILVVTATGFVPGRVAMDLSGGEVERVTVVLRRAPVAPLGPVPRSP
jgi:hypothetical protein